MSNKILDYLPEEVGEADTKTMTSRQRAMLKNKKYCIVIFQAYEALDDLILESQRNVINLEKQEEFQGLVCGLGLTLQLIQIYAIKGKGYYEESQRENTEQK